MNNDLNDQLYNSKNKQLMALFKELAEFFSNTMPLQFIAKRLQNGRLQNLKNEQLSVLVVGEFNHGKSSFINALIGKQILPTGITPTTASITHIGYSDVWFGRIMYQNGLIQQLDSIQDLVNFTSEKNSDFLNIHHIDMGVPIEFLREQFFIIDTPGVNDLMQVRSEITYQYLPQADIVLFVLDATSPMKFSEKQFLEHKILKYHRDKLVCILNKIDRLSPKEVTCCISYCQKAFADLGVRVEIFPLSSKTEDVFIAEQFENFRHWLLSYAMTHKQKLLFENSVKEAQRIFVQADQCMALLEKAVETDSIQLEKSVQEIHGKALLSQPQLDELQKKIQSSHTKLTSIVRLHLQDFEAALLKAVHEQINDIDAKDLQRYFYPFIEYAINQFVRTESSYIEQELEAIYIQILQVAQQNDVLGRLTGQKELGWVFHGHMSELGDMSAERFLISAAGAGVFFVFDKLLGGLFSWLSSIQAIFNRKRSAAQVQLLVSDRLPQLLTDVVSRLEKSLSDSLGDALNQLSELIEFSGVMVHESLVEVLSLGLEIKQKEDVPLRIQAWLLQLQNFREKLKNIDSCQASIAYC